MNRHQRRRKAIQKMMPELSDEAADALTDQLERDLADRMVGAISGTHGRLRLVDQPDKEILDL